MEQGSKRIVGWQQGSLIAAGVALLLTGCGGGGGGGGSDSSGGTGTVALSATVSQAERLEALDSTVVESTSAPVRIASDGRELFRYELANQGIHPSAMGTSGGNVHKTEESQGGSNLLAIDQDGNAELAFSASDLPVKVMYSTVDPKGEYVYLALDLGWWDGDGNNYEDLIGRENCAFFRIKIETDEVTCAAEGLYVQDMDEDYMRAISGDQKPIQFDAAGNVVFSATEFESQCEDWGCGVERVEWRPRIYRMDADGEMTALTQDDAQVRFFLALPNGEVVYYGRNDNGDNSLNLYQDGSTGTLFTDDSVFEFFTTDIKNTVMFGEMNTEGIRFARPRAEGGIERTVMDTSLFGDENSWDSRPRRLMVGDEGHLYGVFGSSESDSNTFYLTVYQMLPYDPDPKLKVNIGDSNWWHLMERTPFQIAKGHLYYRDTVDVEFYGEADVIRMVPLEGGETTTILQPDGNSGRYQISVWRLSGDTLYFSGQDLSNTVAVAGEIDTLSVRNGDGEDEFLTIQEVASASGASANIRDIEVLKPRATSEDTEDTEDTGDNPTAKFHVASENLYSASIEFSKYMEMDQVEAALSLTDTDNSEEIDVMPVWLHQSLHLIPDLSESGLGGAAGAGLEHGTEYRIGLDGTVQDIFGKDLSGTKEATYTTSGN